MTSRSRVWPEHPPKGYLNRENQTRQYIKLMMDKAVCELVQACPSNLLVGAGLGDRKILDLKQVSIAKDWEEARKERCK